MSKSRLSRLLPKFLRGDKSSKNAASDASVDSKTPYCFIHFLDDSQHQIQYKGSWKGGQLLEKVYELLGLHEKDYFSLRFVDSAGQTHWLDTNKSLSSQFKGCQTPNRVQLYFGVKFYAADPCKLREEITRYLFFLQVKQDILQGRLPVTFDEAAELCAYAVQSELGDYDPRHHTPGYVSEFCFVQNQTEELEARIAAIHRRLGGLVPVLAEYRFLDKVKWLDMYGVDLHPVMGEGSVEYFLGLTPTGIVVYKNKNKVGNYFWPRINKVTFKGKIFIIKVKDKNLAHASNGTKNDLFALHNINTANEEHAYAFELARKVACKHLWKCCVEHHAFFRLNQTQERNSRNNRPSRSLSTNRRSGRSERQAHSDNLSRQQGNVIRLPSRRQTRRVNSDSGLNARDPYESQYHRDTGMVTMVMRPEPVRAPRHRSLPELQGRESPRSVKSAPWETNYDYGLYTVGKDSPVSARSDRMSQQRNRLVSGSDSESGVSQRRKYFPNRRGSDNDSDVSVSRRRRREVDSDSASDISSRYPASQGHERSHKNNYAVLYPFHDKENRPNGSIPSLHSAPAGEAKQRRRRRRSKSPGKRPPEELKRHFEYGLKDTDGMSQEQLREIPFVNVETKASLFRLKYSPKLRQKVKAAKQRSMGELDMNRNQVKSETTSQQNASEIDMSVRSQPVGMRENTDGRDGSVVDKNTVGRSRSFAHRPHSYHQSHAHQHPTDSLHPTSSTLPLDSHNNTQDRRESGQLGSIANQNYHQNTAEPQKFSHEGYSTSHEFQNSAHEIPNAEISDRRSAFSPSQQRNVDQISPLPSTHLSGGGLMVPSAQLSEGRSESRYVNGDGSYLSTIHQSSHYTSDTEATRKHIGHRSRSSAHLRYTSDTESSRKHYSGSHLGHRSHRSHHSHAARESASRSQSHLPRSQGVYESDNNSVFRSDEPQRDTPSSHHNLRNSGRYGQNRTSYHEQQSADRGDKGRESDYEHSARRHQFSGSRLDGSRSGQMWEGQGHNRDVPDAVSGYSYRERSQQSNYSTARPPSASNLHPGDTSRSSQYRDSNYSNPPPYHPPDRRTSNTFSPPSQSPSRGANYNAAYNQSNYYDPGQRSGSYDTGQRSSAYDSGLRPSAYAQGQRSGGYDQGQMSNTYTPGQRSGGYDSSQRSSGYGQSQRSQGDERPVLPPRSPYQTEQQPQSEHNAYRPSSRTQYEGQQTHRYSQHNPAYVPSPQHQHEPPPQYQSTPPQYHRTVAGSQHTPPRHQGRSTQQQGTPPRHMTTPPRRIGPSPGDGRYSHGLLSVHAREQSEGSSSQMSAAAGSMQGRSSHPSPSVSDRSVGRGHSNTMPPDMAAQFLRRSAHNPELCTEL